jgi:hypothetical protein
MMRMLIFLVALMLTMGESPARADPPSDTQFCAAVNQGLSAKQISVSDCAMIAKLARGECYFLSKSLNWQKTISDASSTYGWAPDTATLIVTYAISAYCPDLGGLIPTETEKSPAPAPGNETRAPGLIAT